MLSYRPGKTVAHGLDPRSKLAVQVGFAVAAFAVTEPVALAGLATVPACALAAARLSPVTVLRSYRLLLVLLAAGPVVAVFTPGPPWVEPSQGVRAVRSAVRVILVLFVSSAYVASTPVRDSRAAVQWLVPGRAGRLLGAGVGLTFRFLPVLGRDITQARTAIRARGGDDRPVRERARRIALVGTRRAFARADRLSLALRARCFAWNPTLPALQFGRRDYLVAAAGVALAAVPVVRVVAGRFIPVG